LPGYEASAWYGVAAPRNTPNEIVQKLNKEINAGLADPKIKARLADLGGTVIPGSPADFGRLVADEIEKWGKVVKFSGGQAGMNPVNLAAAPPNILHLRWPVADAQRNASFVLSDHMIDRSHRDDCQILESGQGAQWR
jgi:hypothetical protein